MRYRISLLILLGSLLLGCSTPTPAETPATGKVPVPRQQLQLPSPASSELRNVGQTLPISAKATAAGQVIQLEVAVTSEQQAMGLMYRKSLPADRGMLFPFSPPRPIAFWMKNTLIPLDMVFLRNGVVEAIAANVPPCTSDPCPTYSSGKIVIDQVIELRGGRASELGLKVGDKVTIQQLDSN